MTRIIGISILFSVFLLTVPILATAQQQQQQQGWGMQQQQQQQYYWMPQMTWCGSYWGSGSCPNYSSTNYSPYTQPQYYQQPQQYYQPQQPYYYQQPQNYSYPYYSQPTYNYSYPSYYSMYDYYDYYDYDYGGYAYASTPNTYSYSSPSYGYASTPNTHAYSGSGNPWFSDEEYCYSGYGCYPMPVDDPHQWIQDSWTGEWY